MTEDLRELAQLLTEWNSVGGKIAACIDRPAQPGHIAEFIAARVFSIQLHTSASHAGSDGVFKEGRLSGRTVNIKWSSKQDNMMDLSSMHPPDYYLALKGPKEPPQSSRGRSRAWVISSVYLFDAPELHSALRSRGAAIGIASNILAAQWAAAEIYPRSRSRLLELTPEQRAALSLFAPRAGA